MLVSYNWLKEFVPGLPAPRELASRLTMTGTEVEAVTDLSGGLKGVVTAEVVSVGKHPDADRLSLCEVRTDSETYSIVCGARNMKAGDRVALALHGAELPGGHRIKKSKIRGVESQGMMCSEVELGLAETSDGIMVLPEETPLGVDVTEELGLADWILDVSVTPNRPDLLSVRGLAREVSAITQKPFRDLSTAPLHGGDRPPAVTVKVGEPALCARYAARVVRGVQIGPSPEPMRRRLEAHGIRPVNNVVDVTNYVLLELGNPLHSFDLGRVKDSTIVVRLARPGESIETIDGKKRELDDDFLVIADTAGPVAMAGVMGGRSSEVTDSTTDILLECAWFDPSTVRRASRKAGLTSDSSYRFERGVDIEAVREALDRAASLIIETAGGKADGPAVDVYPGRPAPKPVRFRLERAARTLGVDLVKSRVVDDLKRLGMQVEEPSENVLDVTPPSYRYDIIGEADLLEETARLFGYEKIHTTLPVASLAPGGVDAITGVKRRVAEVLSGAGLTEVVNYSFISREAFGTVGPADVPGVEIMNPLSEDQVVMRRSLLPSLVENLRKNVSVGNTDVRIFETAPVFLPPPADSTDGLPDERWKVAGLLYGRKWGHSWCAPKEEVDFFDVKGAVEILLEGLGVTGYKLEAMGAPDGAPAFHPGKSATLVVKGRKVGSFGEAHPDLLGAFSIERSAYIFEIDLDALQYAAPGAQKFTKIARFPGSTRDAAFVVDEGVPYAEILASIEKIDAKLIEKVELFDVYYGGSIPAGKRSMAVRVRYRSIERTLTQAEVEEVHGKVVQEISRKFGAELRG